MTQGVQEQVRAVPAIEPESHLVQVGQKMFGADLVPRSHDAALEQRESGFDRVRRNARAILIAARNYLVRNIFHISPLNSKILRKISA